MLALLGKVEDGACFMAKLRADISYVQTERDLDCMHLTGNCLHNATQ